MYFFHKKLVPFKMEALVSPEIASGNDGIAKTAGGNGNGGGMLALELASQTTRIHPPAGCFYLKKLFIFLGGERWKLRHTCGSRNSQWK